MMAILGSKVRVGIDVVSITNIKESSMMWGCKFQLNLTWVEDRVLWRDLRDNTNLNMISQDGPGKGLGGQVCIMQDNTQYRRSPIFRTGQECRIVTSQLSGFLSSSSPTLLTVTTLSWTPSPP